MFDRKERSALLMVALVLAFAIMAAVSYGLLQTERDARQELEQQQIMDDLQTLRIVLAQHGEALVSHTEMLQQQDETTALLIDGQMAILKASKAQNQQLLTALQKRRQVVVVQKPKPAPKPPTPRKAIRVKPDKQAKPSKPETKSPFPVGVSEAGS